MSSAAWRAGVFAVVAAGSGCEYFALKFAPDKVPDPTPTEASAAASERFLSALEAGDYDALPGAIGGLTAAYLDNPRDPEVTLHLGLAHLWALAENERAKARSPRITDHAVLAEHYFEQAQQLRPDDPRIPAWLGPVKMSVAAINDDERKKREGYFILLRGVDEFPVFNTFGMSLTFSRLPTTHDKFPLAEEYLWKSLRYCWQGEVDPGDLEMGEYVSTPTTEGDARVCYNLPKAPHDIEGFFLHMGDVLTKAGKLALARKAYRLAELSPTYEEWPFGELLEARVADIDKRAALFADDDPDNDPDVLISSPQSCVACHQS